MVTSAPAGAAAQSASRSYHRRTAGDDAHRRAREQDVKARHPKLGGFLVALTDTGKQRRPPAVWTDGADRAVRVVAIGQRLDDWAASGSGYVLHDRKIQGSRARGDRIDHIAITAAGVWVIDARDTTGRVEHVDRGGGARPDWRLTVGGRNQSRPVDAVIRQMELVTAALADGIGSSRRQDVRGMQCFFAADWRLWDRPLEHGGVHIAWPLAMVHLLNQAGSAGPSTWKAATATLARQFPPA
jgi:hypothetical protein